MRISKNAATALVAGAIAGGSAAMLLTPSVGIAQESSADTTEESTPESTTPDADATDETDRECGGFGFGPHERFGDGEGLDAAAATIGIETSDLLDSLHDGQTVAEVAEANGVDPQAVIDAMVAEAQARFDEAVADGKIDPGSIPQDAPSIEERVTAFVNGEWLELMRGHRHGPFGDRMPGDGPFGGAPDESGDEVDETTDAVFQAFTV